MRIKFTFNIYILFPLTLLYMSLHGTSPLTMYIFIYIYELFFFKSVKKCFKKIVGDYLEKINILTLNQDNNFLNKWMYIEFFND